MPPMWLYSCKDTDLPYINLDVLRYWPNDVSIYYAHGIETRLSDISRYFLKCNASRQKKNI